MPIRQPRRVKILQQGPGNSRGGQVIHFTNIMPQALLKKGLQMPNIIWFSNGYCAPGASIYYTQRRNYQYAGRGLRQTFCWDGRPRLSSIKQQQPYPAVGPYRHAERGGRRGHC
ncbi:hypothetical protein Btru_035121 [Bulinus truncatus]|nr:hypothetical protein Btru_035121 [Bulinus truncatus]